jgi:hypothetical protein
MIWGCIARYFDRRFVEMVTREDLRLKKAHMYGVVYVPCAVAPTHN